MEVQIKSHNNNLFYAARTQWVAGGKGKQIRYLMHRVILNVTDGKIIVDHKNGNGLDNQRHNLRLSDKSTNAFNAVWS